MSPCLSFSISASSTSSSTNTLAARPAISLLRPQKPSAYQARLSVVPTSRSISVQRQAALARADRGGLEFGAGLDAELLGEPALVGGEREVGGDQADLAFADDPEQVELRERVGIGQRAMALRVELDRDRVVAAAGDRGFDRVDARARDVRGAEQRVAHAVALDDRTARGWPCEAGIRRARERGHVQSRKRLSRSR